MTSTTMELLERVLREIDSNSITPAPIDEVADALHRFRVLGRPHDEEELIEACEEFLREMEEEEEE